MFANDQVKQLNELELEVYNYILRNRSKVIKMKIRELANEVHVSTTTILRFCNKMGFEGFTEFKIQLKMFLKQKDTIPVYEDITMVRNFLDDLENPKFQEKIARVVELIRNHEHVIFFGIGDSGIMGKFGARLLSNVGKFSQVIDDPFYPFTTNNSLIFVLSVSGEVKEVIDKMKVFRQHASTIVSITNTDKCTVARMSDLNIAYFMPFLRTLDNFNLTTQAPLVLILEMIEHKLYESLSLKTEC